MKGVKIAGIGIELPARSYSNDDVAQMLIEQRDLVIAQLKTNGEDELTPEQLEQYETSNEWIGPRVGVFKRPFAETHETTSGYAAAASHNAWDDAYGDGFEEPGFSLLCTVSPDHFTTPATNVVTARKMRLGYERFTHGKETRRLRNFISADITQACSSFGEGMIFGNALIRSGMTDRGLVVGADIMSRTVSKNRRSPFIILGDGAGAVVLESCTVEQSWFQPSRFFAGVNGGKDGEYERAIINLAGGSEKPLTLEDLDPRVDAHLMLMDGNFVYRTIVPFVGNRVIPNALEYAQLSLHDIDVLILHQANQRMTEAVVDRLHKQFLDCVIWIANQNNVKEILERIPNESAEKHHIICYCTIDHTGNLTSASIPVSLHEAREYGVIIPGKRVQAVVFGGGYSWVSIIIDWGGAHLCRATA